MPGRNLLREQQSTATAPPPKGRNLLKPAAEAPPMSAADWAIGVGDVAVSSARGMVNRPATTAAGLAGAVGEGTYDEAKAQAIADIEAGKGLVASERLRTPQGAVVAGKIEQGIEATNALPFPANLPGLTARLLTAADKGLRSLGGNAVADTAGSVASLLTVGASPTRGVLGRQFGGKVGRGLPNTPAADAIRGMQNDGYAVPAHVTAGPGGATAGGAIERTVSGVAGSERVDNIMSVANQDVTDRFAARANGLQSEFVTPQAVQTAINAAEAPYADIKASGINVTADPDYINAVGRLGGNRNAQGVGVQVRPDRAVRELQNGMLGAQHTSESIVDDVRRMRSQGFKRVASDNVEAQQLGQAQLDAADALDGLLERSLQREAQAAAAAGNNAASQLIGRLHQNYIQGRARRADLHILEDAMNTTTGNVEAAVIHRIGQRRPLRNPLYQRIARAYDTAPTAMAPVARASRGASGPSTLDVAVGGGVAGATTPGGLGVLIASMLGRQMVRRAAARGGRGAGHVRRAVTATRRGVSRTAAASTAVGEYEDEQP